MSFADYYNDLKSNPNNLSYWMPHIKDCGLKIPLTVTTYVPIDIAQCFFMEKPTDAENIYEWVRDSVEPILEDEGLTGFIFIKNGTFSNKFDFNKCSCVGGNVLQLTANLIDINYSALMFGANGITEFNVRERIGDGSYDKFHCIYNGMPLRNEYRIFYDFDNHKALYCVNYWDYDYCYESISRNTTDGIIYKDFYPTLEKHYNQTYEAVTKMVADAMENVTGLNGIWSVDIMEDYGEYWLIDMATARTSAYWNPSKAGLLDK